MYAAPTCGRMLRDFGAEVIKVEDPTSGDYARQWTPMKNGQSFGFARLNCGQAVGRDRPAQRRRPRPGPQARRHRSTSSSRTSGRAGWTPGGSATRRSRPSTRARDDQRRRLRADRSLKEKPGFGTVAETGSGFAYINGWPETPPTSPPFGFADSIAGISAAMGTAMALFRRERTGQGDHVDVALYEPLMFIVGDMIMNYTGTGYVQGRVGNGTGSASPRGVYQAADGKWLSIAASNQGIAKRLFAAMGQPELIENPRYATNEVRMQHNEELQALVKGWVGERPRAEILKVLDEYEVVCSQVNDASDIVEDPHFQERTLVELTGVEALGTGAHARSGAARQGLRGAGLRRGAVDRGAHRRGPRPSCCRSRARRSPRSPRPARCGPASRSRSATPSAAAAEIGL